MARFQLLSWRRRPPPDRITRGPNRPVKYKVRRRKADALVEIPKDAKPRANLFAAGMTVPAAFRKIIAGRVGEFTSKALADAVISHFPALEDKVKIATSVTLKALAAKGEIKFLRKEGRSGVYIRIGRAGNGEQLLQDIHKEIESSKAA